MRTRPAVRRAAVAFTAALLVIFSVFLHRSYATSAQFNIRTSDGYAYCPDSYAYVPAAYQGSTINLELVGLRSDIPVELDVTFPDGRVYALNETQVGLDGLINQPVNAPFAVPLSNGGYRSLPVLIDANFPYGCHLFSARQGGLISQLVIAVVPGGQPGANPGLAHLTVADATTGDASGWQNSLTNIVGGGFVPGEQVSIWVTAPDGTIVPWPDAYGGATAVEFFADNGGRISLTFRFTGANATGLYQFTAEGRFSRYRVIAPFTLTPPPVAEQGYAEIRVAYPADAGGSQRSEFVIVGERFFPGETVVIWVTLPDESVFTLPDAYADSYGVFSTSVRMNEMLPVGLYQFSAKGVTSGSLAIGAFTVEQAERVAADPFYVPNEQPPGGGDGAPTNLPIYLEGPGPICPGC